MASTPPEPHGVLVVDKPEGPSSFHLVAGARKLYHTRRVGHAGTLDPMATGVLVLLFGEATKLSGYLTQDDKTYEAVVRFGSATDTLDRYGTVVEARAVPGGAVTESTLREALAQELQREAQTPPEYSAIKVGGQRAYAMSRRGEQVQLADRAVKLRDAKLLEFDETSARFELRAEKGYYVRSFARDVGAALGLPSHLSQLRRTASGAFTFAEAATWPRTATAPLLPCAEAARRSLPSATLAREGVVAARQGKVLTTIHFAGPPPPPGTAAWFDETGELIAIGGGDGDEFRVKRGLNLRQGPPP